MLNPGGDFGAARANTSPSRGHQVRSKRGLPVLIDGTLGAAGDELGNCLARPSQIAATLRLRRASVLTASGVGH